MQRHPSVTVDLRSLAVEEEAQFLRASTLELRIDTSCSLSSNILVKFERRKIPVVTLSTFWINDPHQLRSSCRMPRTSGSAGMWGAAIAATTGCLAAEQCRRIAAADAATDSGRRKRSKRKVRRLFSNNDVRSLEGKTWEGLERHPDISVNWKTMQSLQRQNGEGSRSE